jgi:hypothetical protein
MNLREGLVACLSLVANLKAGKSFSTGLLVLLSALCCLQVRVFACICCHSNCSCTADQQCVCRTESAHEQLMSSF